MLGEDSKITSADGQPFNRNQGSCASLAVMKGHSVNNAAGRREVGSVKTTDRDAAVAGLLQILQHWTLLKGPKTGSQYYCGSYQQYCSRKCDDLMCAREARLRRPATFRSFSC